jgi:hypothetical protein
MRLSQPFYDGSEIFALNQLHVDFDVMEHQLAMSVMSHSVFLEVLKK